MGEYICLLITLCNGNNLYKCAIKKKRDEFIGISLDRLEDVYNRHLLKKHLPLHVSTIGPIVKIERIFEILEQR